MMCSVVNKYKEPYDVYIGRGSVLGNPYTSIQDKKTKAEFVVESREKSIEMFSEYLWKKVKDGTITLEYLASLDGKVLGCFCKPKPCHGDIIVRAVAWAKKELEKTNE
jgi:hypothetical protein